MGVVIYAVGARRRFARDGCWMHSEWRKGVRCIDVVVHMYHVVIV